MGSAPGSADFVPDKILVAVVCQIPAVLLRDELGMNSSDRLRCKHSKKFFRTTSVLFAAYVFSTGLSARRAEQQRDPGNTKIYPTHRD